MAQYQRSLVGVYYCGAKIHLRANDHRQALLAMEQAIGVLEDLIKTDDDLEMRNMLIGLLLEKGPICLKADMPGSAAVAYQKAIALAPNQAEDLKAALRYNAACAAALAGCGKGADATGISDKERSGWRNQARDWLTADLDLWARQAQSAKPLDRSAAQQQLRHWQTDPYLAGVARSSGVDAPASRRTGRLAEALGQRPGAPRQGRAAVSEAGRSDILECGVNATVSGWHSSSRAPCSGAFTKLPRSML